jgi:Lrp/AsnC family leucine-responsive transcriptional regulator
MSQIDTIDERILAELQANGRLTMKALAERVGLSSPAMIERVRRLEDRGVIAGYRAIVAPSALGRALTALIAASVERGMQEAFLDAARADPAVAEVHRTTGESTYLVKVNVADTAALEALVDRFSATGARCATSLVLSSPVPWREITPPEGTTQQRTRLTRRRRKATAAAEEPEPETAARPRRPGRPRGRRAAP